MCREQQAIMDVEPLRIARTFGPGHNMARAKQRWFVDPRQGTARVPIAQQRTAKMILTYPHSGQALGLGIAKAGDGRFKFVKRKRRQRAGERIRPMQCGAKRTLFCEPERGPHALRDRFC